MKILADTLVIEGLQSVHFRVISQKRTSQSTAILILNVIVNYRSWQIQVASYLTTTF